MNLKRNVPSLIRYAVLPLLLLNMSLVSPAGAIEGHDKSSQSVQIAISEGSKPTHFLRRLRVLRALPALATSNSLSTLANTGPHTIFSPLEGRRGLEARNVNAVFSNQGEGTIQLSITGEEETQTTTVFPGDSFLRQLERVLNISFVCLAGADCQLVYELTYAPPTAADEPASPVDWVGSRTCHGQSKGPPGTACVNGADGDVCVQKLNGSSAIAEEILPDQGFLHSPLRIEVQHCRNEDCDGGNLAGGDIRVTVERGLQGAPDERTETFDVTCLSPNSITTLSDVREITLDFLPNSACSETFNRSFVRWQLCHVPGPWLRLR